MTWRNLVSALALLLCAVFTGVLEAAAEEKAVPAVYGSVFNPSAFEAMPALKLAVDKAITFDTSKLTLTGDIEGHGHLGVCEGGQTQVAVFAFAGIELHKGAKVNVIGDRPLVLISRGAIVIDTTIDLAGGPGGTQTNQEASAGRPGPGGWAGGRAAKDRGGPAEGPGAGFNQRVKGGSAGGGGAFGGAGGETTAADGLERPMRGGNPYGDAKLTQLQGGSGGAGGSHDRITHAPGGGGGGGGALAVISTEAIDLRAEARLIVSGGNGADRACSGGGGSGGALLLAAPRVAIHSDAQLNAAGGSAGRQLGNVGPSSGRRNTGTGGGGGGGRIAIVSSEDLAGKGKDREEADFPAYAQLSGGSGHEEGKPGTFYDGSWKPLP